MVAVAHNVIKEAWDQLYYIWQLFEHDKQHHKLSFEAHHLVDELTHALYSVEEDEDVSVKLEILGKIITFFDTVFFTFEEDFDHMDMAEEVYAVRQKIHKIDLIAA